MGNYLQFALGKVFGTKNERELKRLSARVAEINALEPEMQKLADAEFPLRTQQLKERLAEGRHARRDSAGSLCPLPRSGAPHAEHAAL